MGNVTGPNEDGWLNRQRVLLIALALATLLALAVCFLIIEPFIPTLAIALALAVATNQPHQWLRKRVKHDGWAAAVTVILVAIVIIAPLALMITYISQEILGLVHKAQAGDLPSKWLDAAHANPVIGDALRWMESNLDIQGQLAALGKNLAGQTGKLLAGSIRLITQLVMMLFVLFFLYRDHKLALASIRRLTPLSSQEADHMFSRIADTIHATVNGSLTVAFAQAALAGAMYTILGVPSSLLWGAATFLVALVPVFGTVMVWGPVAGLLALTGSWIKALVLVGWGALAVGTIDNILYPHLVGDRLRLHTVPTFFSIVGGIGFFGPVGLILGPVVLAITIGLLDVWRLRTAGGHAADGPTGGSEKKRAGSLQEK